MIPGGGGALSWLLLILTAVAAGTAALSVSAEAPEPPPLSSTDAEVCPCHSPKVGASGGYVVCTVKLSPVPPCTFGNCVTDSPCEWTYSLEVEACDPSIKKVVHRGKTADIDNGEAQLGSFDITVDCAATGKPRVWFKNAGGTTIGWTEIEFQCEECPQ